MPRDMLSLLGARAYLIGVNLTLKEQKTPPGGHGTD